ncbi:MAG: heme exporter protein CcmB [Thermoleophilia bacterium]|nr:heme exporter protein CcmB [Thermoleophilia bacterium]
MGFLSQSWAIARKDIIGELRTRETVVSMLLFGFLVILVFNFGIEPGLREENLVKPGVLWAAFIFAGILGLNRSFAAEKENDCLQGLLLCPVDRSVIYLGKFLGNFIFTVLMGLIVFLFFSVLYNVDIVRDILPLGLIVVLAAVGFSAVGTLFSALSVGIKTRDVILSILLFPVMVPVVLAAAKSSGVVLDGRPLGEAGLWLGLMLVYDVIFLTVSLMTFDYVVEE